MPLRKMEKSKEKKKEPVVSLEKRLKNIAFWVWFASYNFSGAGYGCIHTPKMLAVVLGNRTVG